MENTAFMSDLFLYIPDVTKPFFKNNEWDTMFKWSLGFCREIPFLDPASKTLFYLVRRNFRPLKLGWIIFNLFITFSITAGCSRIEYC